MQDSPNQLERSGVHQAGRINAQCNVVNDFAAMQRLGNHELFVFGPLKASGDAAGTGHRWLRSRGTVNQTADHDAQRVRRRRLRVALISREHRTEIIGRNQNDVRSLIDGPAASEPTVPGAGGIAARFQWTEYEQLMISEALHRGEIVYNVALRVDPASLMHAAAFQLIRNVLHDCGTVIALRPEDNSAVEALEIVEAALASRESPEHIAQRCRIPSIVSDLRVDRAAALETAEHELLGDLLEKQAANYPPKAGQIGTSPATQTTPVVGSAAATLAESTLRVDAARIDAVMNLVGELIIGKSMLNRSLTEFDQRHARDPVRAKLSDALAFQSRVLDELHKCVLKIRMVPVEQLFRRFPRLVR